MTHTCEGLKRLIRHDVIKVHEDGLVSVPYYDGEPWSVTDKDSDDNFIHCPGCGVKLR